MLTSSRRPATRTSKGAFVVAALAGALVLVGFAGDGRGPTAAGASSPSATASSPANRFNDADVMFAQQMIPHHKQAIQMAQMAPSHAQSPKVKQLAARIEAAQTSEIQTMTGWLHAWGKPVPTGMPGMMSPMPGMMSPPPPRMTSPMPGMMCSPPPGMMSPMPGMMCSPPPGMMSHQDMSRLMAAHGVQFDHMFLQMMIRHHQGAIEMAKTEQAQGVNPAARHLARQIQRSQTAEIAQMQQMLKQ